MTDSIDQKVQESYLAKSLKNTLYTTIGLLTAGYIGLASAEPPKQQNSPNYTISIGNGLSITQDGKLTNSIGGVSIDNKGNSYVNVNPNPPQQNQNIDELIRQHPRYNYSSAQKYIDEANAAYKKNDYQSIILLSEEALSRIQKKEIEATPKEVETIKHGKSVGEYYKK